MPLGLGMIPDPRKSVIGDLLGVMGWAHLQQAEEEAMRVRFPKAFQPW